MNESIKRLLRPIVKHRNLIEKIRYRPGEVANEVDGNHLLSDRLEKSIPTAIGKIGAAEMGGVRHYLSRRDTKGHCASWGKHARLLHVNAGVYPNDPAMFSRFCQEYIDAISSLDIISVWYNRGEASVIRKFAPNAKLISLTSLEPYYHDNPWSKSLTGKRVLVMSPFTKSISTQYSRRAEVWASHPSVMPDFELQTIRTPLSAGLTAPEFSDWFVALDAMRGQISQSRADAVIVGAGAWSLPLVAHAKREGKWALHLGGPTQILFGVKGARWESNARIAPFYNNAWQRPKVDETPQANRKVENGCYW